MPDKQLEDQILEELATLKQLAQQFKAAEQAYQQAAQLIDKHVVPEQQRISSESFQQEISKLKEEIREDRIHWVDNLEQRFQQIIKGLKIKLDTEGIAVENRRAINQNIIKYQQLQKELEEENLSLKTHIDRLEKKIDQLRKQQWIPILVVLAILISYFILTYLIG